MKRCFVFVAVVTILLHYCHSLSLPGNSGYTLVLVDKFGQRYEEYSATDGTFQKRIDNSVIVTPPDIEAYNNRLYVTGFQNAITMYDQSTLQYIGFYKSFAASTQTMKFVDSNTRVAVTLYHEYSDSYNLTMLNFASGNQIYTMVCSAKCFDVLQNPLNSRFLVATSNAIEQYRWNAGNTSLTYDVKYINLATLGYSAQSKVTMQWVGTQLYVGLSNPNRIIRFNAGTSSGTFVDTFVTEPRANWNLMHFAFFPGSTTQLVVAGWADSYQGYLYAYNSTSYQWSTFAQTNLNDQSYVGLPQCVYFDSDGNLLVCDFSWITRWNSTTKAYKDQIISQQGLMYPLGVSVNSLDATKAYVSTANRVIQIDRLVPQATQIFIPRVLAGLSDGISLTAHQMWYNGTFWVQGDRYIVGFDATGTQTAIIVFPETTIDFKVNPRNGKMYAAAYFSQNLYEVDLTSLSPTLMSLTLPTAYSYLGFSANGQVMYTCADTDCTGIRSFNTTTWTVKASSATGLVGFTQDMEVGPDGNVYLYSLDGVFVVNGTTLAGVGFLTGTLGNYRGYSAVCDLAFVPVIPSPSPTPSRTPSTTPSVTPTPTRTPSVSPTSSPSRTPSPSATPSVSASSSPSSSPSGSPSSTPSVTSSVTPTISPTPSVTPTSSPSSSASPTSSPTASVSSSSKPSATSDPTPSKLVEGSTHPGKKGSSSSSVAIGAGVGAVGGCLLLVLMAGLLVRRRNTKQQELKREPSDDEEVPLERIPTNVSISPPASPGIAFVTQEEALQSRVSVNIPWMETESTSPAAELASSMFHKFWEIDFAELEMGDEIGRGAFGSVFKGEWRNSYCVVKQLQMKVTTKDAIASFLKEANTVKVLRNHRNVCTIFGVCTNPEKPICIVMEYCNGGNLQSALINKKIIPTLPNLVRIFKDITSGMSHVHREGIVHCDLACRNMLVSLEGNGEFAIKISDFGFARAVPKEGMITVSDGDIFPIRWSAPELLRDKLLSRAADVWSFGVVMWEIVEGITPYWTLDNSQVIEYVCDKKMVLEEPARITSGQLPQSLYSLMKDCWTLEAYKRPSFDDLTKSFKDLDKDTVLRQSFLVHDGEIETPYWSKESQTQASTSANMTQEKYSRYCKIVRPKPDSGSNSTDPNLTFGNEPDLTYGNKFTSTSSNSN